MSAKTRKAAPTMGAASASLSAAVRITAAAEALQRAAGAAGDYAATGSALLSALDAATPCMPEDGHLRGLLTALRAGIVRMGEQADAEIDADRRDSRARVVDALATTEALRTKLRDLHDVAQNAADRFAWLDELRVAILAARNDKLPQCWAHRIETLCGLAQYLGEVGESDLRDTLAEVPHALLWPATQAQEATP